MLVDVFKALGRTPAREDFEGLTWGFYQYGKTISAAHYQSCWTSLQASSRQVAKWLTPPTTPGYAGAWATATGNRRAQRVRATDVMKGLAPILGYVPFTGGQNVTGQPAISLPLAWSKSGLPIGVQFVGRFGEERLLLQLAAQNREGSAVERATGDRRFTARTKEEAGVKAELSEFR